MLNYQKHYEDLQMSKLNEDGLVAGQSVDFETLKRIENSRKPAEVKQDAKPKQAKKAE